MKIIGSRIAIGFVAVCLSATSPAAVLMSLSRATFQTASSALSTQNFDALSDGTVLTSLNGVTYSSSMGSPVVTNNFLTSTAPNGLGRTTQEFFLSTDSANFSFLNAITAFAIDINTFATANGSYDVVLNTGDQAFSIFETFPGAGTGQFIGFVSDTPFTSVTLTSNTNSSFTLDTLRYGSRAAVLNAVPEPTTWMMMLVGFGAIGYSLRTAKRKAPARLAST